VRPTQFVDGDGEAYFANVRDAGLEGIVAKRNASTYRPGARSRDWLKVKARREQELVVCGWQPLAGDVTRVGSLQLAVHDGDRLVHAGGVGTGFDDAERRRLAERLRPLEVADAMVEGAPASPDVRWVRPELVVRCELAEWTRDGKVRHASYRGIDADAVPAVVTRERTVTPPPVDDRPSPTPDELAALDAIGNEGDWDLGGRVVHLTNLDKVLFPGGDGEPPATKRDLVRYYSSIAPVMLAHLRDRPLNLHRFPNGVSQPGFWHKQVPSHLPDWIRTWRHDGARPGRTTDYLVADHVATLAWLANYGAIELHPWTSRVPGVLHPTAALIDIDPGERTSWDDVVVLARLHRTALDHVGLVGVPKVTGQRGLQVWVPLEPGPSYDDTRDWVEALSRAIAAVVPELVSWEWEKQRRRGRARLDFTQNAFSKTLVAPYSVRATPRATVSMPIAWDELDDPDLRPDRWTIRSAPARVAEVGDLFAPVLSTHQVLPALPSVTAPRPG
jgi:bifunctional non-homologous end joining protein LigD